MRSSKGMYALAKATAISKGLSPTWGNEKAVGFGLTYEELERIYVREGYALKSTKGSDTGVIHNHIYNWKLAGLVIQRGETIFFILKSDDIQDWKAYRYIVEYIDKHRGVDFDVIGLDKTITLDYNQMEVIE